MSGAMRAVHTSFLAACIITAGLATSVCRADLIPFEFDPGRPTVLGIAGSLVYDASTGQVHSETSPISYQHPSLASPGIFSSGLTTIDLFVDAGGGFVSSGTGLTMTGSIDIDGDGTDDVTGDAMDPLLFGKVLNFGAEAAGAPTRAFNGLYEIEGGKLTGTIMLSGGGTFPGDFPVGAFPGGGFFISAENVTDGTLGDFSANFSSDSVKDIVGVATPEPATLTAGLIGGTIAIGFGWIRRRLSAGHGAGAESG